MVRASWVFCDRCGCSVDVELIHVESHHYDASGTFYCADCWAVLEPTAPGTAGDLEGAEGADGPGSWYATTVLLPSEN